MGRKRKGRTINGIVLLNKAVGGSSNQVMQKVRWLYQAKKAGHTGALDPLASGMLPICLGEATKFSQFLLDADKTYQVTAKLGVRTSTSDADGEVVSTKVVNCSSEQITQAALSFLGKSKQVPSMFSALKYQGKPLYYYARQGISVPREARNIEVYSLTVDEISMPFVSMTINCSKGTYIRTIVDDLGELLGCGAYVTQLHRTQVAHYPSSNMVTIDTLESLLDDDRTRLDGLLLPMDTAISHLPKAIAGQTQTRDFQHGQAFSLSDCHDQLCAEIGDYVRVYSENSMFLGVGEVVQNNHVQPKRVVVYED